MKASATLLLCSVVGSALGYYPQRQVPYNTGPNDPFSVAVSPNFLAEPSQRLFWGNQGSNQVGGNGWWAHMTNKFPFLGSMFGRMELPTEYGVPNQVNTLYGPPQQYQQQYYQPPQTYQAPQYQAPQSYQAPQYQAPQSYQAPQYQAPQNYQQSQFFQQQNPLFRQRFAPSGRDVGFTDDAVIVTPPQVPIAPQPAPAPAPLPQPAPGPAQDGYEYNKPHYRLELPHK